MGLFKSVGEAGAKLFGGRAEAATSDDLKGKAEGHDFDASLDIGRDGDRVKLSGQAMTQEQAGEIIPSPGDTIGGAEVDTSGLQVRQPAAEAATYTVKKSDTPWKIAVEHLGKGARYPEIIVASSPLAKDPDLTQPGWGLRIPQGYAASTIPGLSGCTPGRRANTCARRTRAPQRGTPTGAPSHDPARPARYRRPLPRGIEAWS